MPAKWQQWMPFRIDAFKSSPAVQAMHPCARIGYIYLLACAWQTEDCTVTADPLDLAERSGLGDELWAIHGPRILRKFEVVEGGLRNPVLHGEWLEAKRIFDARKFAAERTNTARSPHGHRHGQPNAPSRSPDTRTGTVTETKTEKPKAPEMQAAIRLMELLGLASADYDLKIVAQVIAFEAREAHTLPQEAAKFLRTAAKEAMNRGETVNTFWFKDRKFAHEVSNGSGKNNPSPAKQRLDGNRRALAEAAIKRGWYAPDGAVGTGAEALAEPGHGGVDGGISRRFREAGPEILGPEN